MNSSEDTFLYFAYGSNLSEARIHINNPSAEFYSIAKLEDYKLIFARSEAWMSRRWQGGVASILESPKDIVWGVVWTMSKKDMPHLDRQEGNYNAININVETTSGERLTCRTYQMKGSTIEIPTSPPYLDVSMTGAAVAGLPDYYQKFLSEVETNGCNGPLQVTSQLGEKFKEQRKQVQKQ